MGLRCCPACLTRNGARGRLLLPAIPKWVMIMPGPAAQERKHGRTPSSSIDWREVEDVPFAGAPEMPKPPGRGKWHPMVEEWWKTTSTMPHCVLWRPEDWHAVYELMYEKQRYYRAADEDKTTAQLTEMRRREDALGIGDAARQKLRIRYVKKNEPGVAGNGPDGAREVVESGGAAPPPAGVISIDQRRKNLIDRSRAEAQAAADSDTA